MVSECAKETTTQHYLGAGNGHGPVRSDEVVLFAVFENVPHDGGRLTPLAFQSKQLRRGEVSLARLAHTARAIFDERVIQALEHRFGKCLGITRGNVSALRAIQFEVSGAIPLYVVVPYAFWIKWARRTTTDMLLLNILRQKRDSHKNRKKDIAR